MPDAPYVNQKSSLSEDLVSGEILHYLETVGGGNEFRENREIVDKWFNEDGSVNRRAIQVADVFRLVHPRQK